MLLITDCRVNGVLLALLPQQPLPQTLPHRFFLGFAVESAPCAPQEKYISLLFMVWAPGAVTAFVKIVKQEE
jgi:hypothetical protein